MSQVFVNNGVSTLAANALAADTTIFIQAGHVARFPTIVAPDYCFVTLENAAGALEIVKVTAHAPASASLTVARGQQGTTALDWLTGDLVELRLTKDELNRFERAALRDGDTYSNTHDFLAATLKVKTPTTAAEAATKAYVDAFLAAAAAAGAAGQLPNQAGKAGAFLKTNGSVATFEFIPGIGGTVGVTGDLTLTSNSDCAYTVAVTAQGYYLTLPVGTTLAEGVVGYLVNNPTKFDYGIKDSSGTVLGWVLAGTVGKVSLVDSTTAAGTWALDNVSKVGTVYDLAVESSLPGSSNAFVEIIVDANRTAFLWITSGTNNVVGVIYDASTKAWGNITTLATSVSGSPMILKGLLYSTDKIVISYLVGSDIGYRAIALTGTSFSTIGAQLTRGYSTLESLSNPIICNGAYCQGITKTDPEQGVEAITVSGTTCSAGTYRVLSSFVSGSPPVITLIAAGTVLRTFIGGQKITPFTVSGNTLTVGTGATPSAGDYTNHRILLLGTGNVGIICNTPNSSLTFVVSKLVGTTETANVLNSVTVNGISSVQQYCDVYEVSSGKIFILANHSTGIEVNLCVDTAGVPSKGTSINYTLPAYTSGSFIHSLSGSTLYVWRQLTTTNQYQSTSFDCSGASPVELNTNYELYNLAGTGGLGLMVGMASADGAQGYSRMQFGNSVYSYSNAAVHQVGTNSIKLISSGLVSKGWSQMAPNKNTPKFELTLFAVNGSNKATKIQRLRCAA